MRRLLLVLAAGGALAVGQAGIARAGEQTLTFRSGPITVKPYFTATGTQVAPSPNVDGYVVGMSADVVDAAGSVVPYYEVMLHHVAFAKVLHQDLTCSSGLPAERFYAEGEERFSLSLPAGYGYANRSSDVWALVYMLMNHRAKARTVYVRYTVRYVTDEPLTSVTPVWLDVRNCSSDPVFDVPGTGGRASSYSQTYDWTAPSSGRLVAGGAHLHGGGLRLELADTTCSRTLFTSDPSWLNIEPKPILHEVSPSHMTSFASPEGIPVAAGDRLRLTAVYDNSLPHTRVMGIMILYLVPGAVSGCPDLPPLSLDPGTPSAPPLVRQPLPSSPAGPAKNVRSTWVGDYSFGVGRAAVKRGTTFTWRFIGSVSHNVTLVNGPIGFSSPSLGRGALWSYRFTRAGVYQLFCSLHPVAMTEIVTVK